MTDTDLRATAASQRETRPRSQLASTAGLLADAAGMAIDHARSLGFRDVSCTVEESAGCTVRVAGGNLDNAVRDGGYMLDVTIFDSGRKGRASSQSLRPDDIRRTTEQAVAIAAQLEPDEHEALADERWMAFESADPPLYAPSGLDAAALEERALEAEAAALNAGQTGVRVLEAGMASHDMRNLVANSRGFLRESRASLHQIWCAVIADKGNGMARDAWQDRDRRVASLLSGDTVGREATARALAKLDPRPAPTGTYPVLIDATVAASLVMEACGALGGQAQHQRTTFLPDALGQAALAGHVDLVEDPHEPFGLASHAYDDEAVAAARRTIVEAGTVTGLFLNVAYARRLGMAPTGSADGYGNLTLSSRGEAHDRPALLRSMRDGLWLTEFLGGNVNPVTGAYSKAAAGFWVEGGIPVHPVHNLMISGNIREMLMQIVSVGDDVHRSGPVRTGSILIEAMQVTGGKTQ